MFKSNKMIFIYFLDPYKDPEVEEWAARKIQRSFKDFKTQKSRTNLNRSDIEEK